MVARRGARWRPGHGTRYSAGEMVRALSPRWILVGGFALFVLYAFPGYMSTDSVAQLLEARSGHFSDAHPPLMSAEWWVLDRIVSGPILMLLLQGALFLGGLCALLGRALTPRQAAFTAVGILLFPPVLTTMAVIWKDSQMAAYLVAGIAAVMHPRLAIRLLGLGLLVAACALRHNAVAAVVPVVAILFEWTPGQTWRKRLPVLIGAALATVLLTFVVSRLLTSQHVKLTPVFTDINGVIAFSDDRSDEELRYILRGTGLARTERIQAQARYLYYRRGGGRVVYGDERLLDYPQTPEAWEALSRAWKELILDEPTAYLAYHWDGFARILGLDGEPLRAPVWNLFLEAPAQMPGIEHVAAHSDFQVLVGFHAFYWLADDTPLFRPYVYALVALLLLVLCCRDRLTFALFTSGLLYELSFFPVGAEPDYRYSHWMVTTVVIASVLLFIQRRRRRGPRT